MKRALVVAVAVVLGLTLLWLLAGQPSGEPVEPTAMPEGEAASGDVAAHSPDAQPQPPAAPPQPLAVDAEAEAATGAHDLWRTFPRAACTGRVVDEAGAPLEGVIVSAVPDAWVLMGAGFAEESGLVPVWFVPSGPLSAGRVALDALPSARSDSAGRFSIGIPYSTDRPATRFGNRSGRELPELLAHRDGSVPARRICTVFGPAGCDVGDIVLPLAATVSGRTVDEDGQPLAGVDLEIGTEGLMPVVGDPVSRTLDPARHFNFARSGEDGRFRLSWLRPGTARLSFDVASRLPASQDGIVLTAGTVSDLGDIVLERGPAIRGRVLDEDGRPFPNAEVRISIHEFDWTTVEHPIHIELRTARWGRPAHSGGLVGEREGRYGVTRTGDDGSFLLGGLTRKEYGIYAAMDGCEPDSLLHVATGSDGVRLQLRRQGRLRVRLVDDIDGTPVGDATVTVRRGAGKWFEDEDPLPVTADTDSEPGVFVVDHVCPAPMAVIVESTSHGRQIARIEGLALGAPLEVREVRVPLGASVAGRVVDSAGAPLAGATIRLSPYDNEQALGLLPVEVYATSATDGRFEFTGLTPARWSLSAQLEGFRCSRTPDVVAGPGETHSDVEFVMIGTGHAQGVVRDADGHPVNFLMVAAKEDERGGMAEDVTRTDADGRFDVEVRPGTYVLQVTLADSAETIGRTIDVAANETVQVDFTLPAQAVLSGRVLAAGVPCTGATVSLRGQNLSKQESTDEHGEYRIVLPAGGEGDLWARSPRGGLSPTRPVVVKPGESVVLDVEFGSLSCSGTVVDSLTGAAIPGAKVSFSRKRGPNHANPPVTDANGRFVVGDVAPGQWSLLPQHERYLTGAWVKVELAEGVEAPPLRLELTPGAAVAGVVLTANGLPTVQDLEVTAWREGGSAETGSSDSNLDAGAYELIRLEPGRYTLLVTRDTEWGLDREATEAIAKARATIDVVAGQTLSLDLTLPPGER